MIVYKFGGASVNDAEAIRRAAAIIQQVKEPCVVVISAIGKTTNKLENALTLHQQGKDYIPNLDEIINEHRQIRQELNIPDDDVFSSKCEELFRVFSSANHDDHSGALYSRVVSWGELMSTRIMYDYLKGRMPAVQLLDARDVVKTQQRFKNAEIAWSLTEKMIRSAWKSASDLVITQGFIGSSELGETTTLGREGSDYTASIFAYCLDADAVTTWKDVDGILTGDPKRFDQVQILPMLSYQEASELTYYGAKVIHPKTIQPLADKHIPLFVRSFLDKNTPGTIISDTADQTQYPCIILKENQMLLTLHSRNLSFIDEKKISVVFHLISISGISLNLIQMGATSLTLCVDNANQEAFYLTESLSKDFRVRYNDNLELITIKNYTPDVIEQVSAKREILFEQVSRTTCQIIVR